MGTISTLPPADNKQKYENYKEQFRRLELALKNHFYLEATFIAYAIMEDRTESILRHGDLYEAYLKSRGKRSANIDSKLRFIQKKAECKADTLHKYFSDDLLEQILDWKDDRNRLIHALLKQDLSTQILQEMAAHGSELAKELRTRTSRYNRVIDNHNKKVNV